MKARKSTSPRKIKTVNATDRKTKPRKGAKQSRRPSQARSSAAPAKIAHMPAHEHAAARQKYVPGQLIVRCKEDVTYGLPDVRHASIASLHTFALPEASESPFKKLEEQGLIREVKPI